MGSTSCLLVGLGLVGFVPVAAYAQDSVDEQDSLEEIVVTGSRIARDSFLEASTPVNFVGEIELKLSGTANAEDLLNSLPQLVGNTGGSATSSRNVGGRQGALDLRGLGPSRNLVLVNGRRFTMSDLGQRTDINTIPAALIERIEVVTGGSSAVYGSDAITGVVNFILRDDFEGIELRQQTTFDSHTTTPIYDFNVTLGANLADDRGNVVISAGYLKRELILQADRDIYSFGREEGCVTPESASESDAGAPVPVASGSTCTEAGGVIGFVAGGSSTISEGRFSGIPTFASLPDGDPLKSALAAAGLQGLSSLGFIAALDGGMGGRPYVSPDDTFSFAPFNYMREPQERYTINAFGHFDFHDKVTGYTELHFSDNKVDTAQAPNPLTGNFLFDVDNPFLNPEMQEVLRQLDLRETGATTVTTGLTSRTTTPSDGLAVLAVNRRLVETGPRLNHDERTAFRTLFGIRGDLGNLSASFLRDLSYDAYHSFTRTMLANSRDGLISRSRIQAGLLSEGAQDPVLNIFGAGNVSDAAADTILLGISERSAAELQVAAATLAGEAFDMPTLFGEAPGALAFSFGGEWRRASGQFNANELLASGDVAGAGSGAGSIDGEVTVREVFGEVRVPLLAGLPLVENLTANGGFRLSDYDLENVGTVRTYLGGADWQLAEGLALRGQFQRAIRAPNLNELFATQTLVTPAATDPCALPETANDPVKRDLCIATGVPAALVGDPGVQPNFEVDALGGGNPNLEEERADTYTFGGVITPSGIPGLAITVDYFSIELIGAVGAFAGGADSILNLCYNVIQDINSDTCQAINRNPLNGAITAPFFIMQTAANIGSLETAGIDVGGRYSFGVEWGLFSEESYFDFRTDWTWLDKFTETPLEELPEVKNICVGAFGNTCGAPKPELKGVSRLTWQTGPLSLSLRHRFIDAVQDDRIVVPQRAGAPFPDPSELANPSFKAQHYLDISFTYDVIEESFQLYGGVNNVTDNDPPFTSLGGLGGDTFGSVYDVLGPNFFFGLAIRL